MTDGPFRNLPLSAAWKRYGEDLVNDAKSKDERIARAGDAVLAGANIDEFSALTVALQEYADRLQLNLDPLGAIECILQEHSQAGIANELGRNLVANLSYYDSISDALGAALAQTTEDLVISSKNRLDEDCMRSRDLGDMNEKNYRKALVRNGEAFAGLDADKIAGALRSGNRHAFSAALQKKVGVDDGPDGN